MTEETIFRTIPEQVAAQLKQEILDGTFKSGTPLREQALSERFGVSRGPIREVFSMLADQGLLVKEANKGVRVAFQPSADIRPLITDLRRRIELFVLEELFDRIGPGEIEQLESILAGMETACRQGDQDALREQDIHFHTALIQMHPNPDLFMLWRPIMHRMEMQYVRHGDLMDSYEEHRKIVAAIRSKDRPAALNELAQNIT